MLVLDNPAIFREFVDLLPFGAYLVDTRRHILYWNHRAEQITGFLAQEVVGRNCPEGLLDHCAPGGSGVCNSEHCPLVRAMREGRPAESRLFLRHKEGHRVPVLVRALPLRDEHGRLTAIAEVFQEESVGPDGLCWITEDIDRFDKQMGLPSSAATRSQLQLSLSRMNIRSAAFVIEIEDLVQLVLHRGRELANVALRALAQTTSRMLTMPHYLGCWPASRLLVVVPNCESDCLEQLKSSLEDTGRSCSVTWWGERVQFRVRVRACMLEQPESLESLLLRLDPESAGEK